jgi:alkanesulfonate monooxygenase
MTGELHARAQVNVYSVTPESVGEHQEFRHGYRDRVAATATASEQAGWAGILVPHNLHEVDPWVVAAYLGSITTTLVPLLAVQPACMPPHTAAACAGAYAMLYGRHLHFNLVAGARDDEMCRIGDTLTHDQRYDRLCSYGRILAALLRGEEVDETGEHYSYHRHRLEPYSEVLAQCRIFVAGSSPASMATAEETADVVVTHPRPCPEWRATFLEPLLGRGYDRELGIRVGVLCRPDRDEAWKIAMARFPESWLGRQHTLLKTRSQNSWARDLAQRAMATEEPPSPDDGVYWLGAFRSGRASAPFLVGDYAEVADELAGYLSAGVRHVLLDGGLDEDFGHTRQAVRLAVGSL